MTTIELKRRIDYFKLKITSTKDINYIKYDRGHYIISHFFNYGHMIKVESPKQRIFKIYDKEMYSDIYSIYIVYTDSTSEVLYYTVPLTTNKDKNYYQFIEKTNIVFSEYAPIEIDRLIQACKYLIPIFGDTSNEKTIINYLNSDKIKLSKKDNIDPNFYNKKLLLNKLIFDKSVLKTSVLINNITTKFLYGFLILSEKDYTIVIGQFNKPIQINKEYNLDISLLSLENKNKR